MENTSYSEVEHFKRFAEVYLSWAYSNFDRIVRDAVRRQEPLKPPVYTARFMLSSSSLNADEVALFYNRIRAYADECELLADQNFWQRLLTGTKQLFKY